MTKDRKQQLIDRAREDLAQHQYKQLASWGEGGSEVWECSRPGSSCYAFTICITRMGIAVVGDIHGLLFGVGSSYGMPFLAGKDVDYYIHSKLEHDCRKEELDQRIFQRYVAGVLAEHILNKTDLNGLEEAGFTLPKWLDSGADVTLEEVESFAQEVLEKMDGDSPDFGLFHDCCDTIGDAYCVSNEHEAYEVSCEGVDFDWHDAPSFMVPSESLMVRLYMVNEAAKRIMAIKEGEAEARAVGAYA